MIAHPFGTINGEEVLRVDLQNGGLCASVMTWGAVLRDLRFQGQDHSLVLGFDEFASYPEHSPYFGAIVGRFANRIGNGSFELDGARHETDKNFRNRHTLHGGYDGTSNRIWEIVSHNANAVTLQLIDPGGSMGFPGTCRHNCRYALLDNGALEIELTSKTDAPTVAGLAHHSYFNLDGSPDCRDHVLQINATSYLPVDNDLIPTGRIADVKGTQFDFLQPRQIGRTDDFDHNYCLASDRRTLTGCATAKSTQSGIEMQISTTEPGLQFYTGQGIDTPEHQAYAGFCLETQNWPDAPNNPGFPGAVLRPGETLRQTTRYSFSKI